MYNFVVTKPFEQTHNALMDLYPCMRMYNLDTCQAHFMRALTEASDPTREDWAFKVSLDTCQAHFMRALTEASDPTREDWAFKVSLDTCHHYESPH